jgi:hypothetical protein
MSMAVASKPLKLIGRAEHVDFPRQAIDNVPARIDTGAKTSSVWASNIRIEDDGKLHFTLFDTQSEHYTGDDVKTRTFDKIIVASSTGAVQERFRVKLLIRLQKRRIKASFTLADRSMQVYPILVGRNVLRGKFIVDVRHGKPSIKKELERERTKKVQLKKGGRL